MVSFLQSVEQKIGTGFSNPHIRVAAIRQAFLLNHLKYLGGKLSVSEKTLLDEKTFKKFFNQLLKPSRFAKNWKLPVLHSFVLTVLIALGDDPKLRKKVGALLQKTDTKNKHLSKGFEKDPEYYGHYLSLLPPKSERFSQKLLALAS